MRRTYFIIEHPRRGTLREIEWPEWEPLPVAHFSWSGSRSDESKAKRFMTIYEARTALAHVHAAARGECRILRAPRTRGELDWVDVTST